MTCEIDFWCRKNVGILIVDQFSVLKILGALEGTEPAYSIPVDSNMLPAGKLPMNMLPAG